MVDNHVFGITNGQPRPSASLAEFIITSRLEAIIEAADRIEHRAPHEQVGGRAEAFLHVTALPEEPFGVDELGSRRRRGKFEMDATCDARDGREGGEPPFEPVRAWRAVDVRESDVRSRCHVQACIACRIRSEGPRMNQESPARQELFPQPDISSIRRSIVDPDHLDRGVRISLAAERVNERAELRPRISERNDDRNRWRHSGFRQPVTRKNPRPANPFLAAAQA